jgi:hypothetical protein
VNDGSLSGAFPATAPSQSGDAGGAQVEQSSTLEKHAETLSDSSVSDTTVTPLSRADVPSAELPPVDPALFERARDAVSALRGRGRRQNGQAGAGNTLALRTGLRSMQLLNAPDVAAWHAEQVSAIMADLGGEAELSSLARASVREVARLEVILAALGEDLLRTGVLTGKGKSRSATTVYLHVLDRFTRLSQALGLARTPKSLGTLADVSRAVDEANR